MWPTTVLSAGSGFPEERLSRSAQFDTRSVAGHTDSSARWGASGPRQGRHLPPLGFDPPIRTFFPPARKRTSGSERKEASVTTLDNLRKAAKRWLKALRARDPQARARLARAYPGAPQPPTLRDFQHALARERGHESWTALTRAVDAGTPAKSPLTALLVAAAKGDARADLNGQDAVGLTPARPGGPRWRRGGGAPPHRRRCGHHAPRGHRP